MVKKVEYYGTKRRCNSEFLQAGKKRSLHSPAEGVKILRSEDKTWDERYYGDLTHDYSHVFGWNREND